MLPELSSAMPNGSLNCPSPLPNDPISRRTVPLGLNFMTLCLTTPQTIHIKSEQEVTEIKKTLSKAYETIR